MEVKKWIRDVREPLAMLAVQVITTGLQLLSRVILSEGTFTFALMMYRHFVGALTMAPFAFYLERFFYLRFSFRIDFVGLFSYIYKV